MASFDYKIYEELKEIKKEIRSQRAIKNLVKILGDAKGAEDQDAD